MTASRRPVRKPSGIERLARRRQIAAIAIRLPREILVAVPVEANKSFNVGKDDEGKAKAEQIRGRALAGESFEKLASDLSESPSRSNAGLIGPISVKDLSPDFQKLVSSMKPGDITEPLRSQRGYQILKLESSTGSQTMPFEQAREQIGDRVFTDKRQAEFQKYRQKLRAEAIIEWKNPDLKRAYESKDLALVQRIRPGLRPEDLQSLRNTFDNASKYSLDLRVEAIEVRGNDAQARAFRQDVMVAKDGQIYRSEARVTVRFKRVQDRWTIDDIK